jgi:hypothetical protein
MRTLSIFIVGLVFAVGLSTPAGADTVQHRHHDFNGPSSGEGHSRYDRAHHDDDDGSILF